MTETPSGDGDKILVTSALPYANGSIHLGHLAGAYLPADIFVRYQRQMGRTVLYICGSDEHGVSIPISAQKEKVHPKEIIDRYHELNKLAFEKCGISFDNYSRTSLPVHHETAQGFFLDLLQKNILKKRVEKQLYDEKVHMFLPDRYVTGTCPNCQYENAYGDQCERCGHYYNQTDLLNPKSLITGETPVVKETLHWYFPLGDFQDTLEKYVHEHEDIWKDNVLQQCKSWLKVGLGDRPITRDLVWGVEVPLDEAKGKVLYVWFEAVLGYISSTKEWAVKSGNPSAWKDYWHDPKTRYIAFIGKDNIVFHCLMFPAMLMAAEGYVLPENVPANEFLNLEGQKFSKSRNWSIELNDFLEKFPPDTLRYTLALNLPETRDSDFYWKDFQARTNNELADIFGNFINRTLQFVQKNFKNTIPPAHQENEIDKNFVALFRSTAETITSLYESYKFRDGVIATMNFARAANKYFNDSEPWKTVRENPAKCATTIHHCIQAAYAMSILFEPILPFTIQKLRAMLNIDRTKKLSWSDSYTTFLPEGYQLGASEILFQKIEDEVIEKEILKLKALSETKVEQGETVPIKSQITIDDFRKIDLRVGKILSAERVKKSDKLIKLQVDIGSESRQLVAGIGKQYEPDAIVGKNIIVVANLAPAKLFGIESYGMILASSDEKGHLTMITPMDEISSGCIVK